MRVKPSNFILHYDCPQRTDNRMLEVKRQVEGKYLLRFEGAISADDLNLMAKTIEKNCEKVDISGCPDSPIAVEDRQVGA